VKERIALIDVVGPDGPKTLEVFCWREDTAATFQAHVEKYWPGSVIVALHVYRFSFVLDLAEAFRNAARDVAQACARARRKASGRPSIVALCGSTRFRQAYAQAFRDEEHAGKIVLTVPCFKDDPCCKTPEDQARLDRLHLAKIDLADEVLVLIPGGYIGESTRREIAYAYFRSKPVRFQTGPCPGREEVTAG
jgi:hypothetical protein